MDIFYTYHEHLHSEDFTIPLSLTLGQGLCSFFHGSGARVLEMTAPTATAPIHLGLESLRVSSLSSSETSPGHCHCEN